jgi:hypothetical protein
MLIKIPIWINFDKIFFNLAITFNLKSFINDYR